MIPIVVFDTNALQGRKPLTNANSRVVQALSKSRQIRLVVPSIVLHELSRQWAEEADEHSAKLIAAQKALNEMLVELGEPQIGLVSPSLDRQSFYTNAERHLVDRGVEVIAAPNVSVDKLQRKTWE